MGIENMTQESIKVEGMSCMHCQLRVKKAVEAVEGVQKADVNLQTKQVLIMKKGRQILKRSRLLLGKQDMNPCNYSDLAHLF